MIKKLFAILILSGYVADKGFTIVNDKVVPTLGTQLKITVDNNLIRVVAK